MRPVTKRFWILLALLCGAAACAPGGAGAESAAERGSWRRQALWDDGRAEFCVYDVSWRRYGELFDGRALLILVKEPWAPELEVKADRPRADGFDVLKLNHVRDVATGIYTYHQMASVFLRRDSGALQKLSVTSSEGCGISTAQMVGGELETRSYFDGQGERKHAFPEGALPEDGLPALLRDYLAGEAPPSLRVFPSLMHGRFPELAAAEYRLSRRQIPEVEVAAGRLAGVELRLEGENGWLSYLFEAESPHRLLRFERDNGTRYELAKCERLVYWQMNRPGGEAWLPETLR